MDVRAGKTRLARFAPQLGQLVATHPRQQQVLVVRDAHFTGAVLVCQVCGQLELVCRGVARGLAQALERQGHGAHVRVFVGGHIALDPATKFHIVFGGCFQDAGNARFGVRGAALCQHRRDKAGTDAVQLGLGNGVVRAVGQDALVLGLHLVKVTLAFGLDQNLDARFVDVVAAAPAVVDTHHGFEVVDDLVPGQEGTNFGANHRCAAHATAHKHLKTHLTLGIAQHAQANVVPSNGGTVFDRPCDGDLELAWQVSELRVQGAPLAQHFGIRTWVHRFVHRNARALVAGDVANAVAAGLNAVQVDAGQELHHVGAFLQRNPVELHVLAGGEVGVVRGQLRGSNVTNLVLRGLRLSQQFGRGRVIVAGDGGQHAQLRAVEFTVRHGHTQHGRVALDVPAVLQTQRAKLVVAQGAGQIAGELVAVLRRARLDKLSVKFGVLVHLEKSG